MTALLFVRGMLKHVYDVLPEDIHWFRRRSEHVPIKAPAALRIDNIEKGQTLDGLLEEGKLDAVAVTSPPQSGLPHVQRLFPNASPTFPTEQVYDKKSQQKQSAESKGLHYICVASIITSCSHWH